MSLLKWMEVSRSGRSWQYVKSRTSILIAGLRTAHFLKLWLLFLDILPQIVYLKNILHFFDGFKQQNW